MALENDWIKVLYKPFLQSIHGEYLKTMSSFELSEDLFYIAQRAIAAFRFPKVSLDYTPHYVLYTDNALLQEQDQIIDADEDTVNPNLVHSAEFTNTIDFTTIQVILAWMKVY